MPDMAVKEYNICTLLKSHAHSILAYIGHHETYAYMSKSLWWRNMARDVERFCVLCTLCMSSKTSTQHPWSQIGVDFVGPLPQSKTSIWEFDMIGVIIDHLSFMVHIIPTQQDYMAKDIAEVLYSNIYKLHRLPDIIVSDHDKLFTAQYYWELPKLRRTELKSLSAYHLQTNGMTE